MPLKLTLKANEKIIIGGAVVRNGSRHAELTIENNVPILRQKDIMTEGDANSPARRVYFIIQLLYIDVENRTAYLGPLQQLLDDIATAAPSSRALVDGIRQHVENGHLYQALKVAHQLIDYETELISHAVTKPAPSSHPAD